MRNSTIVTRTLLLLIVVASIDCTSDPSPRPDDSRGVPSASPIAIKPAPAAQQVTLVTFVRLPYQLPAPVQRPVAVTDDNKIYIAGGLNSKGASTSGVFRFSPGSGHIQQVGTMPQAFHDAAGDLLGGRLVVFGGGAATSIDTVQAFELATGKASVIGHLPMPLSDLTGAMIGRTVYLVGGWNGISPQPVVWSTTTGTTFMKVAVLPPACGMQLSRRLVTSLSSPEVSSPAVVRLTGSHWLIR